MRTIVSVAGKFHMFFLAKQLQERGYLERFITSYPKFEAIKYGIERGKTRSILIKEILERGWHKLPFAIRRKLDLEYAILEIYDRLAARQVVACDIFTGFSSSSLYGMRRAKELGALAIAEHASSHPIYQRDILSEEYEKFGVRGEISNEKIINKELRAFEEADYITVPSKFVKRTFLEKGIPEAKIIHVPFGVDLGAFRQVEKEDNKFRVVFAGGLSLRKGVHYLLQACAELNLPNSELMLMGALNDEIKPFFSRYAGSYRYLGHIPHFEMYKYYSQGSVFAMMSIEEGLAYVQAQAMACGLPVICTTNTGGDDIVRDGIDGFVIPIRNVDALKEKLLYLYERPEELKRMSESAKQRVASGFTWDDYGKKIVAEYERVLAKKTHEPGK
ncbi:MAG: group 1 glycosyl transferase [Parcubacteria group bacterium LiPW_15]|nr:MAG: group 1 glycosyl transferase [Parcubacteria group bacterium LiPW_15]